MGSARVSPQDRPVADPVATVVASPTGVAARADV